MASLRIVFIGTAPLACPSLAALARTPDLQVVAVVTQPDRPKGRALHLQPSSVKSLAVSCHLPVLQPERARTEPFLQELRQLAPDLIVVIAYGQILPKAILDLPRYGCLNVHASLLPKYRGAAPIQWAILNDERETGVTIMKMDEGLDTGGILATETTPIGSEDNSQTLHDRLAAIGAELLVKTIPDHVAGRITSRQQPKAGATYARKITREDGRLDWNQPARALWNRVRAFVPWPGTYTFLSTTPKPLLLKVWRAEPIETPVARPGEVLDAGKSGIVIGCGQGALRILALQREGGRRLTAAKFLAGHGLTAGQKLVSQTL